MIDLFIDIDNTLIYSHRKKILTEKISVETINGKIQSYITKITYDYLIKNSNKLNIIPITLRNIRQYNRILPLLDLLKVKETLLCNGSIMIRDNIIDEDWTNETILLAKKGVNDLKFLINNLIDEYNLQIENYKYIYCRIVSYNDNENIYNKITDFIEKNNLEIYSNTRNNKIYIFPTYITKGNAIKRYIQKNKNVNISVSCGDSEMDISMLDLTDIAITNFDLSNSISKKNICYFNSNSVLSDYMCEILKQIIKGDKK